MTTPKPRTDRETWDAIMKGARAREHEHAREDEAKDAAEMDRIVALSEEELHAELAADGFDVAAERARGEKLAKDLLALREAEAKDAKGIASERARLARIAARRGKLPRAELERRIVAARVHPRLPAPVALMFRNRKVGEDASDEELESLLTELEAHIERAGEGEGEGGEK